MSEQPDRDAALTELHRLATLGSTGGPNVTLKD
jgi:hypothetical protein